MKPRMSAYLSRLLLPLLIALAMSSSCGGGDDDYAGGDTNTNWLKKCDEDAQCGSVFSCMCGRCTLPCQSDLDCSDQHDAVCLPAEATCPIQTNSCQLRSDTAPMSSSEPSATASMTSPTATTTASSSPDPPTGSPIIMEFSASEPTLGGGGGDSELSWQVSGADSVTIESTLTPEPSPVSGDRLTVSVDQTTTYTLTATNAAGTVKSEVTVEVSALGIRDWTLQADTGSSLLNNVTASPAGDVFVAGWTDDETAPAAFAAWYPTDGGEALWSTTMSTDGEARANDIALAPSGMFIVGFTDGTLNGTSGEGQDAFIVKYSGMGDHEWTRLITTVGLDVANAVAVDQQGNALVVGQFNDADLTNSDVFVAKYSAGGDELWFQQLGMGVGSAARGVIADSGGDTLTVVGSTSESLERSVEGPSDGFIARLSTDGTLLWVRQLGGAQQDIVEAITTDREGNLYIAGSVDPTGATDGEGGPFVAKLADDGETLWITYRGGEPDDSVSDIALDSSGNVLITGSLVAKADDGTTSDIDPFVAKYSSAGDLVWEQDFGSDAEDHGYGLATDEHGYVYVGGSTFGDLGAPNDGQSRSFLIRFR